MKIINNKKEAIEELKRISTRTNSDNNNEINTIVYEILQEVKISGDIALKTVSYTHLTLPTRS